MGRVHNFTVLLAIVNPLGVVPIFVSLMGSLSELERRGIAQTLRIASGAVQLLPGLAR